MADASIGVHRKRKCDDEVDGSAGLPVAAPDLASPPAKNSKLVEDLNVRVSDELGKLDYEV